MSFLHPAFLLGLASLGLPLLFHLLKRRRIRQLDFPTLRFFHQVRRRVSLLFRIGHLLLLLLRLLVLALVTLLFAQPFFTDPGLRHWNSGPRSLVLLWDNSLSTAARLDGEGFLEGAGGGPRTVAEELRRLVGEHLASRDARDRLEVVALSPRVTRVYSGNPADFRIEDLPGPTAAGADWIGGIDLAARLFDEQGASDRSLVMASDFQARDFRAILPEELPRAMITALRPATLPRRNLGLVAVEEQSAHASLGRAWAVRADVLRTTPAERMSVLQLVRQADGVEEVLAEAVVPEDVGTPTTIRFEVTLREEGVQDLRLRLRGPADALPEDDEVPLRVEVRGPRRILAWNGDPNPAARFDELFYLEKAARAAELEIDEITSAEELAFRGPASYAAFHLANVPDPTGAEDFVEQLLEAGGALVLWPGSRVEPAAWNRSLLEDLGHLTLRGRAVHDEPAAWRYASPSGGGPLVEGLGASKYWVGIRSTGYWFVDEGPRYSAGGLLAAHADGTPAVYIGPVDRGWLVWVGAGADIEDSDLPMHPIYPALVRRTSRLDEGRLPTYRAGERVLLPVEDDAAARSLKVLTPGERLVAVRPELRGQGMVGIFRDTLRPGIYTTIAGTGSRARREAFQVRRAPRESRLEPLPEEALARILPDEGAPETTPVRPAWFRLREVLVLLLGLVLLAEAALVSYLEARPETSSGTS